MVMRHFKTALAATLPALVLSAAAWADTAELRYKDLDLSTETGRAELAKRVDAVARKACTPETITGSRIPNRSAQERCIDDAKRQIEAQLAARSGRNGYGR